MTMSIEDGHAYGDTSITMPASLTDILFYLDSSHVAGTATYSVVSTWEENIFYYEEDERMELEPGGNFTLYPDVT